MFTVVKSMNKDFDTFRASSFNQIEVFTKYREYDSVFSSPVLKIVDITISEFYILCHKKSNKE